MFIVTGLVKDKQQGGYYNLLAQRPSRLEAEKLSMKLKRNKAVRHVKIQTVKEWEDDGCPCQLALFQEKPC